LLFMRLKNLFQVRYKVALPGKFADLPLALRKEVFEGRCIRGRMKLEVDGAILIVGESNSQSRACSKLPSNLKQMQFRIGASMRTSVVISPTLIDRLLVVDPQLCSAAVDTGVA